MGAPCVSIGVEELKTLGVETYIRIGTTGALQDGIKLGDSIIPTGAIRDDGTMDSYLPKAFPAVGNFEVLSALKDAAEIIDNPYHMGIVQSTDAYYGRNFNKKKAEYLFELYQKAGTLAVEMEVSSLYLLGNVLGIKTGAILTTREEFASDSSYVQAGEKYEQGMEKSIQIVIKAIELMIQKNN